MSFHTIFSLYGTICTPFHLLTLNSKEVTKVNQR